MKSNLALIAVVASICSFQACKKSSAPVHTPVDYQLILRPDASTGQDTYVSKRDNDPSDGNTNLNFANELILARVTESSGDSFTCHGYLRFDSLVKVPTNATVTSAMLYLYGEGTDSSASIPYGDSYPNAYNLSNDGWLQMVTGGTWDQKTITFNNAPAATAAGEVAIPPSTQSWNYNVSLDVTGLVKQQVANPGTNFGFMLKLQVENIHRSMEFAASECPDSLERPKLVVNYSY